MVIITENPRAAKAIAKAFNAPPAKYPVSSTATA